jgi:hypothetical protein
VIRRRRDVVYDVLVADAPCPVGPADGETVVPGLDGLDGALGAEGADGPPALRLPGSDDVEGDELGIDAGLVAVDGDQVVVGGVVAPAQGRVRCHRRGHGRCDLRSSGEGWQAEVSVRQLAGERFVEVPPAETAATQRAPAATQAWRANGLSVRLTYLWGT